MTRALFAILLCVSLNGCRRESAEAPRGTGAHEAVQAFYDSIIKRDWGAAFALLDGGSQKAAPMAQFVRLAESYRSAIGFEPTQCFLKACEEKQDSALAHIVITGDAGNRVGRFSDGIALRKTGTDWRIVLPANFGHAPPPKR